MLKTIFKKSGLPVAFGSAALASAIPAYAAIDVANVTTAIGEGVAAVVAIGGAALVVIATAAVFKWVRRAM